jgi:hypothetical protein
MCMVTRLWCLSSRSNCFLLLTVSCNLCWIVHVVVVVLCSDSCFVFAMCHYFT